MLVEVVELEKTQQARVELVAVEMEQQDQILEVQEQQTLVVAVVAVVMELEQQVDQG
jgi:hypothetical protein